MSNDSAVNKLKSEAEQIRRGLKYIYREEKAKYDRLIELQLTLFRMTKQVMFLIDICRLEKAMHGGHTLVAKRAAVAAFEQKKIELTLFFLLSHLIVNQPPQQAKGLLDQTFAKIKTTDFDPIKDLYYGSIAGAQGNVHEYNDLICRAKTSYTPGIYWQLNLVVDDFYFGADDQFFLSRFFDPVPLKGLSTDTDFVFSISCDSKYFKYYADSFLESFFINNPNALVHIFYVDHADDDVQNSEEFKKWTNDGRVSITHFSCPSHIDYRPVSAVLRLLAVHALIVASGKPVFFGEIDSVIKRSLKEILQDTINDGSDHLVRTIGSYLPWQRNTCGFGLFLPTKSGRYAARLLERYVLGLFNNNEKLIWADQCALEACIRYSTLVDSRYKAYRPAIASISSYILTPTGGGGSPLRKLDLIKQEMQKLGYR